MTKKNQKFALISVYNKSGIDKIAKKLSELNIGIISTGGTEKYLNGIGIETEKVEKLTDYPSIFGGRVKTLHPKIFGGILYRRDLNKDIDEKENYKIPEIEFVIVDLYPFEDTVNDSKSHEEIIEKIDIGGISLIRAAAKNYNDVVCVSSTTQYEKFISNLGENQGNFSINQKKEYAVILNLSFSHKNLTIGREIKVIIEAIIKYPMIILIFISIYPIIKIDIK